MGFEPTASASRTQRSTKLSHSPYSNRCPTYHIDVQNAKASEPEIGNLTILQLLVGEPDAAL